MRLARLTLILLLVASRAAAWTQSYSPENTLRWWCETTLPCPPEHAAVQVALWLSESSRKTPFTISTRKNDNGEDEWSVEWKEGGVEMTLSAFERGDSTLVLAAASDPVILRRGNRGQPGTLTAHSYHSGAPWEAITRMVAKLEESIN